MTDVVQDGAEPLAIVGLAVRVPGAATTEQFWRNLVDGVESITFYTAEEQLAHGATAADLADPSWVPAAPVIDQVEYFDAEVFAMSDREADLADPQHRLFLETAHSALEDAGYDPMRYPGAIGVYAGTGADDYKWLNLHGNPAVFAAAGQLAVSSSNSPDYVATLVSYKLNLRGPSLTVHTACSTSMVALHLACEALRGGECDLALAGGVCVELPHGRGYPGMEGYTSPDGHCRPFDAGANGTLWGSGVGVAAVKRLADAIADGDHVRAVVLGNAINNDGSAKVGFSAPSVRGQSEAVAAALAVSGVDPRTITYLEAHGTGTALGDPVEVEALAAVYGRGSAQRQWCAIGSVKSNIGHLSQAAGIVGVAKAVLALEHGLIPPTLNLVEPNPAIDFPQTPFYLATALARWESDGAPRRAGVSSFGIGGTNAHLVLQEAPERPARPATADTAAHLLPLSAASEPALQAAVARLADHLETRLGAGEPVDLADVAFTLRVGRTERAHRAVVVATDGADAVAALRGRRRLLTGHVAGAPPRVVFLFSGQGAQHAAMGAQLYQHEPVFAATVDRCAELLRTELDADLRTLLFAAGQDDALRQTANAQPALFVISYALAELWRSWDVVPDAMIGHSVGELVAATVAGVFELPDALHLVATRGRLMQAMPPGAMLAVHLDEAQVGSLLPAEVEVATVNGPGTCVVAGPPAAIADLAARLSEQDVASKALRTSHAFHSAMMEPVLAEFAAAVAAVPRAAPRLPFLSNVTGDWVTAARATDPGYWAEHVRAPVRFGACVATVLAAAGDSAFVECGPGRQLSGLASMQVPRDRLQPQPSLPGPSARGRPGADVATLYGAAGRLWLAGVALAAERFGPPGRRVRLPGYPYQRRRHWIDPDPAAAPVAAAPTTPAPIEEWFAVPTWRQLPMDPQRAPLPRCLVFVAGPRGEALVARLRAAGTDVTTVQPPGVLEDYGALLEAFGDRLPDRIVHALTLDETEPGAGTWEIQDRGFFGALRLIQALAAAGRADGLRLDLVTTGTADAPGALLAHPEHATLAGLARVLPQELAALTVRLIDADPADLDGLAAELSRPDGPAEVVLREGRRWVLDFAQVSLPAADQGGGIRPGGRYLITGGLGGIGLTLAEDLARHGSAGLVLVSRTGMPPREAWDTVLAEEGPPGRTGRAIAAIRRMEHAGATVLTLAADVTDPDALRRVREAATAALGGLDGVVHAAGVPGGGLAEVKERGDALAVLAPKLAGTLALRDAFADLPLDFVALCSSVTAIGGGLGQVDYCAANAFLDAFARSAHGMRAARVVALNWGGWLEVGMAAEVAAPALLRRRSPGPARNRPVLEAAGDGRFTTVLGPDADWLLAEHRIGAAAVVPGTAHIELARAALAAAVPSPGAGHVLELTDVVFTEPLAVPDGSTVEYSVAVAATGEFEVTATADGAPPRVHVRGAGAWVAAPTRPVTPVADLRARLAPVLREPAPADRRSLVSFGPRWECLREQYGGDGEELALLEAGELARADLGDWVLHPALLDVATSFGRAGGGASYLPLGYGRIVVHRALPGRFYSHLRYRQGAPSAAAAGSPDIITADLALVDPDGALLVEIGDYMLRRVDPGAVASTVDAVATLRPSAERPSPSADPDERWGIRPADGADAFRRVIATDLGSQVVIATMTVADLVQRARRVTTASVAVQDPAELAVAGARALAADDYVAPRTEIESTVAAVWSAVLGLERVGVEDNFFAIGGNSLIAVQLVGQIRKAVGVRVPMRSLFEAPTVAGLAARVAKLRSDQAEPAVAPALDEPDRVAEPSAIPRLSRA